MNKRKRKRMIAVGGVLMLLATALWLLRAGPGGIRTPGQWLAATGQLCSFFDGLGGAAAGRGIDAWELFTQLQ